jgi:hypothetical protein
MGKLTCLGAGRIKYLEADLFKCLFNVRTDFRAAAVRLVLISVASFAHNSTRQVNQRLDDFGVLG